MGSGVTIIIGMATLSVASGISEKVLTNSGKPNAATYCAIASESLLAMTAITTFVKFIQALRHLVV